MRSAIFVRVAAVCVATAAALAAVQYQAALQALSKVERGVTWDTKGAITADVTCDGKPDLVIVGKKGDVGVVAVVPSLEKPGEPIVGKFPTNRPGLQDGFCGTTLRVISEPRDCEWVDGPIPGCKVINGCTAFRVEDGECDSFHFYWDNKAKMLTYNRL